MENATLHVPAASVEAYKAAESWSWHFFKNIVPLDDVVGISGAASRPLTLRNEGDGLVVEGASDGTPVSVYSVDGRLLGSAVSRGGSALVSIATTTGMMVIVKIGNKSEKIIF